MSVFTFSDLVKNGNEFTLKIRYFGKISVILDEGIEFLVIPLTTYNSSAQVFI